MNLYEAIVDIKERRLLENVKMPAGSFANMTPGDVTTIIERCLGHPSVLKEVARLQIPLEGVVCEPWP